MQGDHDNLLRSYRALRGKSQAEAARECGVSRTLWSAWEGKVRSMSIQQLKTIKRTLCLSDLQFSDLRAWLGTQDPYRTAVKDLDLTDEANLQELTEAVEQAKGVPQ
jgi:transcriptional regulator with XRE-family HTH domain